MTLAVVAIEEAVGAGADTVDLDGYLHLLGADVHSGDTADGFTDNPVDGSAGGTVYSYERWVRARFETPFNSVRAFRFFSPTMASVPDGWTFNVGSTDTYATPVNTASSIATTPLTNADPGRGSPNAGGSSPLDGSTDDQFSDWIVIQAVIDTTAVAGGGPAYGYDGGDEPILIEYDFVWTETE